ncbi:MAG TPA: ABC transporter ATP-binding protein [Ktedonobacteraceae bacterium]|nr:ABC transporter ATP-binding protein [Ktedonobacteraceae bacterium]
MSIQEQAQKLLDVTDLTIDYEAANGTVHAVKNVSFTLHRGEILGIAGESGCGKSTLAYGIARLLRPPAQVAGGQVLYYPRKDRQDAYYSAASSLQDVLQEQDSIDILQLSSEQLRAFRWHELSIVFQSAMNALNPVMTIGMQIIDVLQAHLPDKPMRFYKRRAIELLDLVGITADRLNSYPHQLSGGMRQRTVIAIALALRPDLIIMDEPTTALDVVIQREILELISSLCKEFNTALIFITHDLSLLLELSHKIAIMYAGNLVEQATSREMYHHPGHPYSYGLLNAFPTLDGPQLQMVGIPGAPPDLRQVPPGCAFNPRCIMAFDACRRVVPQLRPVSAETSERKVACHLYDPRFSVRGPTTEQIAYCYETLSEGARVE